VTGYLIVLRDLFPLSPLFLLAGKYNCSVKILKRLLAGFDGLKKSSSFLTP
jgi:hypothetical protein